MNKMKSIYLTCWLLLVLPTSFTFSQNDHYLTFDGNNDYIALQMQYTGTNAIASLTVEAWVNTAFSGSSYSDNWAIIDFDRSDFYNVYVRGDNGHVGFSTYGGNIHDFQGSVVINDGLWHHIAVVYDGNDKYIYVDGVLDATVANPHSGSALGKNTTRYGLIGDGSEATAYNGSRNNRYYDGSVSELRIWHTARTGPQIQSSKERNSLLGTEIDLEAYYTFENGTATDLTGNGHNGELFGPIHVVDDNLPEALLTFSADAGVTTDGSNGVTGWSSANGALTLTQSTTAQYPLYLSDGINGQPALQFDGVDDFLQVPDLSGLNTGGPFTEKTFSITFETGNDISTRQMLYEQGGGTRGFSLYIENGRLLYTAWNVAEDNWGPINIEAPLGTERSYVATMAMDANAGTLTAYLNGELVETLPGVMTLYAHSDDGGLGSTVGSTRFASGGSASLFQGKVAHWTTYNLILSTQERSTLEQPLLEKYVLKPEPAAATIETVQNYEGNFNGNISAMRWRGAGDEQEQLYTFSYDGLNRLKSAQYAASSGADYNLNNGHYSVPNISYDLNGNITALTRQGLNGSGNEDIIDELAYTYGVGSSSHSNQLLDVSDTRGSSGFRDGSNLADDYTYDDNGNMVQDLNKDITDIEYNFLNLPRKVTFHTTGDSITYLYDAAGIKLQQVVYHGGDTVRLTDYIGGFVYEEDTLQFIQTEEGRIVRKEASDKVWTFDDDAEGFVVLNQISGFGQASPGHLEGTITANDPSFRSPDNLDFAAGDFSTISLRLENSTASNTAQLYFTTMSATSESESKSLTFSILPNSAYTTYTLDMSTVPTWTGTIKRLRLDPGDQTGSFKLDHLAINAGASAVTYDYQYHLKDHLGNVRTTFSTESEHYIRTATFEDATSSEESHSFGNFNQNRVAHPAVSNTGKAARLNHLTPAGPYAIIKVDKRDTVKLSVKGYYEGGSGYSNAVDPAVFENALGDALKNSPMLSAEGVGMTQVENGIGFALSLLGVGGSNDDQVPGAYLNYLFFDTQMNLVINEESGLPFAGFKQLSSAANFSEETLTMDKIIADRDGYVIAYLSNESNTGDPNNYVYFDDFTVYHGKTHVVSTQDYYPFGLQFNQYKRTASTAQNFTFNGKEKQEETGWVDYGARMYMPEIGRWNAVDPLSEHYQPYSPYNYVLNNPISYIDPDGTMVEDPITNVIVLVADGRHNILDIAQSLLEQGNENWHLIGSDNFEDAANDLNEYTNNGEVQLDNLIVGSHGFPGGINADGKAITKKDVETVNNGVDDMTIMTASNGNDYYFDEFEVGRFKPMISVDEYSKVSSMQSMAGNVKEGGNVIFTACSTCSNSSGTSLGEALVKAFGGRVNVYLNGDQSSIATSDPTTEVQAFKGGSLTAGSTVNGWTKFSRDGAVRNVGSLIVNLKGSSPIQEEN